MAFHSKSDFCKLIGKSHAYLKVNIDRGKVILSGDYIDDSIVENSDFLKKRLQTKTENTASDFTYSPKEIPNIQAPSKEARESFVVTNPTYSSKYDLETAKKSLDIEKIQEEIEILKVKKEKLHGEVIPTDVVRMIFAQHFKSVTISFQNGVENLLIEISKKADLNRNQIAEVRGKMIAIVNASIQDAVKDSKKSIKNIVSEYSERKGVGERE